MRRHFRSLLAMSAALVLTWGGCARCEDPASSLSLEAEALIAPVHAAFAQVEAAQANLPPAKDANEKLERMLDLDAAGRQVLVHIDFSTLPADQRPLAESTTWADINTHDAVNVQTLKSLMPADGWFTAPAYSDRAREAAFLIVQHAGRDFELQHDVPKHMEPLVPTGKVRGEEYAMLYDRVSLDFDHKPQRYGSQVECKAGRWQPFNLEDPQHVDALRKTMGGASSGPYQNFDRSNS